MHGARLLRHAVPALVLALATVSPAASGTKIVSSWKSPDLGNETFAGKKVAALVMSSDESLRISAEEALARELTARGARGVAAYRVVPREELTDAAKARGWFERASVDGVVVLRIVSADKERVESPVVWTTPYYSSFWNYYGYGWTAVYAPVSVRENTIVVIETLVYSVPRDMLLWAGTSQTTNPAGAGKVVHDLTGAVVKEMKKQGLVGK
jgi:hypothetical protein